MNELRVRLYERLMEARSRSLHHRYARGVSHESVLAAMDAAENELTEAERREDLHPSSPSAYVEALGGRLKISATFDEESIVIRRDPLLA